MPTRSKRKRTESRKKMNNKRRPIISQENSDSFNGIPIDVVLQGLSQSVMSTKFQAETLFLALQRKGIISDAELIQAGRDVTLRQQRIRSLMSVQGIPRVKGLAMWTQQGDGAPISPEEVRVDRILLDPKTELTGRERCRFAMDLKMDQTFQQLIATIEHDPEGTPVPAPWDTPHQHEESQENSAQEEELEEEPKIIA